MSLKEAQESFSSNSRGPVHEDRRLQIEELDEWQMHKPRTPDKPKLRQNEPNTSPNQLKVGDKVLLDAADPYIATTTPNEEIPFTVLVIFPFSTVEVSHPKFGTFKVFPHRHGQAHGRTQRHLQEEGKLSYLLQRRGRKCPLPQFRQGELVRQLSVLEFSEALGLYTEELKAENELHALSRHIHFSPSKCWHTLAPSTTSYNPSCSKASVLPPSLRSTGVVNTHDVYFFWCMSQGHVIDIAYFIALAIQHQTERHRKEVISIGPYVTRLGRHFGLLNTPAQESSLTLIGQMSPQGISSMLSIRMIERRRGTYPLQYRLARSTEEEAYKDIPDDVPPQHEDQPTQPPPPSCLVHAVASYADISERLTRFEQQCYQ
ncbi:hypothetical protein GOBAR_AA24526 [Gossypium barbadense]|uniref:Uncharacterized protein n=1 Tax=Gossypium barbadense TaxID=3634 RepID=A0A2P5WYJ3_GOSBA|nr:hypothetical protein GOBAR_AA24526 [Gossypium barbadense]